MEPMLATKLPDYPWQKIDTDLFQLKGATYLLVVDYFSRYPEIKRLTATNTSDIVKAMNARFRIPETVLGDNSQQYASQEFKEFAKSYGFNHVTSSPLYPQSNGQAERAVKTVKHLLKLADDPEMAMLTYRSTPFSWCGLSPAELLMRRRLRTNIPLRPSQLIPHWKFLEGFRQDNEHFKRQQKRNFDQRHGVRHLPELPPDHEIWVKTGDRPELATVVTPADTPRSYIVRTRSGQQIRRNRQHLRAVPDPQLTPDSQDQQD